jgi:serine---pyruvate transaminase
MTPGPTQVPEQSLLTLARQVTHHRTDDFRALFDRVQAGLREILQTENDIAILCSSGTGGMEAAVVNLISPGEKMLVLHSGKFAERWSTLGQTFGAEVIRYEVPWGEPFEADRVAEILAAEPDIKAVFGTLCETSTGVGHDVRAIGQVVKDANRLWVVDAISSAGIVQCRTDQWGIDVLVVGSQKALMTPPGLALLSISPSAWQKIEQVDQRGFYFDLLAYRKAKSTSDTPFTPPKSLLAALAESVDILLQEGIESVWARGVRLARTTRAAVEAIGLELVTDSPSTAMTAVKLPESIDAKAFLARLESRFGLKLAGGQGPFRGKIFRLAHMGLTDDLDIIGALAAIELVLKEQGCPVQLGAAVTAAEAVLAENADQKQPF